MRPRSPSPTRASNRAFRLYALATRARLHVARGRWDAAVADAEEVLAQAEGPAVARMPALTCLGLVEGRRGQARADGAARGGSRPWRAATGELQRLRPVACALAELAWLRGDSAAIDEVTREAVRARARGRARLGRRGARELALARRRPGRRTRLRRAPPAPDRGRAAGRRRVLARDRRPLPGRALPRRQRRPGRARRGARRSPTSSAPRPSRRALRRRMRELGLQRPARAAAVHPRQPGRAHEPAARDPRARRDGRDERRDRPHALPHPEDRRAPRRRGAWRSCGVTTRAAAVARAHELGLVETAGSSAPT